MSHLHICSLCYLFSMLFILYVIHSLHYSFSMLFIIYTFIVITIVSFKIVFIIFAVYVFIIQLYICQCSCYSYSISFSLFIVFFNPCSCQDFFTYHVYSGIFCKLYANHDNGWRWAAHAIQVAQLYFYKATAIAGCFF